MKINANISAIIANNELSGTESALSKSLERLSSGLKINHSEDDAAGMAMSQKMKTQLRGIDRSNQNAADGISVIETAEGALSEIQSILQRMRELSVAAANDANCVEDRESIQKEIDSLGEEIDRISRDTEFNMQSLIDGNLARRAYTDTNGTKVTYMSNGIATGNYAITVLEDATQAVVEGGALNKGAFAAGATEALAGNIIINDISIEVKEGDSLNEVLSEIQKACSYTGCSMIGVTSLETSAENMDTAGYASVDLTEATNLVIYSDSYGSQQQVTIECENDALANALGLTEQTQQGTDIVADFASMDGARVGFDNSATMTTSGQEITVKSVGSFEMKFKAEAGVAADGAADVNIDVTDLGMMVVHIGANEKQQIEIDIPAITRDTLRISEVNVMNHRLASSAITSIDAAIESVSVTRSKLGAYQNRLEYAMSNLDVSEENLTASLSRITDVDMAEEMTEYTSLNVLSQAGVSMLSQANARPESVLQLLQ